MRRRMKKLAAASVIAWLISQQPQTVGKRKWASIDVGIGVKSTLQTDGVRLQITPDRRVVIPEVVVMRPRLLILILPREYQIQRDRRAVRVRPRARAAAVDHAVARRDRSRAVSRAGDAQHVAVLRERRGHRPHRRHGLRRD